MALIIKLRYSYRKQIKIDSEAQFSIDLMFNDELEKKNQLKKDTKNNRS
jgi:hypothetical protein